MLDKLNTWLLRAFCLFWMLFILLDYLNFSPYFNNAVEQVAYLDFLFLTLLFTAGFTFLFGKRMKPGWRFQINNFKNIYLYLFVFLLMVVVMLFYIQKTNISTTGSIIPFIFTVMSLHLGLILILTAAYNSGSWFINRLPLNISMYTRPLIALATGFTFMAFGLFILGAAGILNQFVTIGFILLMVALGWRNIISLFKKILASKTKPFEIHALSILPLYVILLFIAVTLISVIRPIPIGFDALTLYMNTPKLIAGYGALTEGGQAYNWSLIMSLGFVLFKNTALTVSLSVLPGILCIIALYRIAVNFVNRDWAIFTCAAFYTFPNIVFQSRYDAKVDLAMLFVILCCVLLVVEHYFRKVKKPAITKKKYLIANSDFAIWAICGLLFGFAFGIKYTALFSIFGFLILNFYIVESKWSAIGVFFLNFSVIFGLGLTKFSNVDISPDMLGILVAVPAVIGIGFIGIALKTNPKQFLEGVKRTLVFGSIIAITFVPWAVKNISEQGKFSIDALISGKDPLPPLQIKQKANAFIEENESTNKAGKKLTDVNVTASKQIDKENIPVLYAGFNFNNTEPGTNKLLAQTNSDKTKKPKKKVDAAKYEEVNRYIGYEEGIIKFISLPYDLTMKQNVNLWTVDFGLIFYLLIPLLMFSFKPKQLPWNILKMILLLFALIVSVVSIASKSGNFNLQNYLNEINTGSFSEEVFYQNLFKAIYLFFEKILLSIGNAILPLYHYLTIQIPEISFIIIIVLSVPVFYLFWPNIKNLPKKHKMIFAFIYCSTVLWLVLASGILWYGFVGFSLLPLIIAIYLYKNEEGFLGKDKVIRTAAICFSAVYFYLIVVFQLVPIQMTMGGVELKKVNFTTIFSPAFVKYSINETKQKDALKTFYGPAENNIISVFNKNKEAKILNVYTSLDYHIINNDIRIYNDNQLTSFERIFTNANGEKDKIIEGLKDAGLKYVLISFATPNMDNTPEKSLTDKYNKLLNSLVNNPGAKLMYTNRIVERPDGNFEVTKNGKRVKAKYELAGVSLIEGGTMAMYEIL